MSDEVSNVIPIAPVTPEQTTESQRLRVALVALDKAYRDLMASESVAVSLAIESDIIELLRAMGVLGARR